MNWLPAKLRRTALGDRKNRSGLLPEHVAAITEYAALPWYSRAVKHTRAWIGNRRLEFSAKLVAWRA